MNGLWWRWPSKRQRPIGTAVVLTVVATIAVTMFTLWSEARWSARLADARSAQTAEAKEAASVDAPEIRFREVARSVGVVMRHGPGPRRRTLPEDTGSGIAWGDVDTDGHWDLIVVNFPAPSADSLEGRSRLFQNRGERFRDISALAGIENVAGFGMGATFADFDDDGFDDLYLTHHGPNRLYRNQGDGTFADVTQHAGVGDSLWSTGTAWGDFDRDGDLDFYVCNYVDYDPRLEGASAEPSFGAPSNHIPYTLNPNAFDPVPNRLYRNRGNGTFEEVAKAFEVDNPEGRSFAATFCDLENDGWLDLYVANDVSANRLFHNRLAESGGGPTVVVPFENRSWITGGADGRGSMGLSVAEIGAMNGKADGIPDLFLTHWVTQENALYQSVIDGHGVVEYRDRARPLRLAEISIDVVGWGCGFFDMDNDGRIDLAVANGSTLEQKNSSGQLIPEPMFLFWNDGRVFHDVAPKAGLVFQRLHHGRGLAFADFNDDGKVDFAVSTNRGAPMLLRNDTTTPHRWMRVRLLGSSAARFGAKVELTVGGQRQYRWYNADVTFLGMHATDLGFGLGAAATAERLVVRWADGVETRLDNVPAGNVVVRHP